MLPLKWSEGALWSHKAWGYDFQTEIVSVKVNMKCEVGLLAPSAGIEEDDKNELSPRSSPRHLVTTLPWLDFT